MARLQNVGINLQPKSGRLAFRAPPRISTVTISMHQMSVGVFSQILGIPSGLFDHADVLCRFHVTTSCAIAV